MITFTTEEYHFLKKEFGCSQAEVDAMEEDELLEIGDQCFDIEMEEDMKTKNGKLSSRGQLAGSIAEKIND